MTSQTTPCPRLHPLGDAAWIVEFGAVIDETTHARVMGLAQALADAGTQGAWPQVLECVPAYTTLTVHFHSAGATDAAQQAAAELLALARSAAPLLQPGRSWRLPLCLDADFAPDLQALAQARGLSLSEAEALLTNTLFRVYMLGFQPGFPYMGGLPAALEVPRLSTPRTAVPERSVAVAGRMCAVYPWRSPGGWHLVGRTPLNLFDALDVQAPAWLQAGDQVRWFAIDRVRFDELERRAASGGLVRSDWLAPLEAAVSGRTADRAVSGETGDRAATCEAGEHAVHGAVEFAQPGAAVSIQDRGRVGHRAMGVPLAGAADPLLMACANALLAQPADRAVLEVALLGPVLRAVDAPVRVALVGDLAPVLTPQGGAPAPLTSWRSVTLQPGDQLAVGPCRSGIAYVALAGGAAVPLVLGSRSTYARAALGGIEGRAPRVGDRLVCAPGQGAELQSPTAWQHPHAGGPLRVLPGPQQEHFDAEAWQLFLGSDYSVTADADRMGLRLQGAPLQHVAGKGADIVSEAVAPGAVQVPGAGQPIVLGVDAQTIGGYAKIATVITADLPRLAHARPGSVLRFAVVTREQALAARAAQAAALADWVRQLRPLRTDGQPDESALYASNLISGMIDAHAPFP